MKVSSNGALQQNIIQNIAKNFKHLEELELCYCVLGDNSIVNLVKNAKKLKFLNLSESFVELTMDLTHEMEQFPRQHPLTMQIGMREVRCAQSCSL